MLLVCNADCESVGQPFCDPGGVFVACADRTTVPDPLDCAIPFAHDDAMTATAPEKSGKGTQAQHAKGTEKLRFTMQHLYAVVITIREQLLTPSDWAANVREQAAAVSTAYESCYYFPSNKFS